MATTPSEVGVKEKLQQNDAAALRAMTGVVNGLIEAEQSQNYGTHIISSAVDKLIEAETPNGLIKQIMNPTENKLFPGEESRHPVTRAMEARENFHCMFTKDPVLLLEYFKIREEAYKEELMLDYFSGRFDDIDPRSHIVLGIAEGHCIGGARLTVHDPLLESGLPLEEEHFRLADLLPEYNLKKNKYGEYSRLAMKKGYRNGRYSETIYMALNNKSKELGMKYVFAVAPLIQARSYKLMYKACFGLNIDIRHDISVPQKPIYEHLKMCLSVLRFD